MQLLTEVSGLLASITGLLLWLPQGRRVWRDRHEPARLAGISVPTQVLSLAGNVLWLVHAVGIGSFWLGAPSVVNVPIAVMTIVVVRRAGRGRVGTTAVVEVAPHVPAVPPAPVPGPLAVPVLESNLDGDTRPDGLVLAS